MKKILFGILSINLVTFSCAEVDKYGNSYHTMIENYQPRHIQTDQNGKWRISPLALESMGNEIVDAIIKYDNNHIKSAVVRVYASKDGNDKLIKESKLKVFEPDEYEDGIKKTYYPDGKIETKYTIKNGVIEGEYLRYHPNGEIDTKSNYKNGKLDGKAEFFSPEGKLQFTEVYKGGNIISIN